MIVMTEQLAWAAAFDAGNRHMRQHNRTTWNDSDYNEAVRTYNKLMKGGDAHSMEPASR